MKTNFSLIFLLFFSFTFFGQEFPSPQNFTIEICYNNYPLGGGQFCGDEFPPFATVHHYSFDAPDTTAITATLVGYNLYVNTTLLGTYTSTQFSGLCIEPGDYYVTAVYANPDGESESSNIFFSSPLLSVDDNEILKTRIYPNPANKKTVNIETNDAIKTVLVYNSLGQIILKTSQSKINFQNFDNGIFYIKIITDSAIVFKSIIN